MQLSVLANHRSNGSQTLSPIVVWGAITRPSGCDLVLVQQTVEPVASVDPGW